MRSGKLRHRVTIQRYVLGSPQQTATGQPDGVWTDFMTVWASIEPLSGRELFAAQEHHSEITHRVRMRHDAGVTAQMRISFDGRIYSVYAMIDPELRGRELQLMCGEGLTER